MGDIRSYPEGRGAAVSRYINDVLVEFGVTKTLRTRLTTAQVNAGVALLPALPGVRWRLVDARLIAIGGNAATATSVNIRGIRSGSAVQLLVVAIAALTQSALVRAGAANAVLLADGASFTQLDANAAVTGISVGTLATATAVDFSIDYVADPA